MDNDVDSMAATEPRDFIMTRGLTDVYNTDSRRPTEELVEYHLPLDENVSSVRPSASASVRMPMLSYNGNNSFLGPAATPVRSPARLPLLAYDANNTLVVSSRAPTQLLPETRGRREAEWRRFLDEFHEIHPDTTRAELERFFPLDKYNTQMETTAWTHFTNNPPAKTWGMLASQSRKAAGKTYSKTDIEKMSAVLAGGGLSSAVVRAERAIHALLGLRMAESQAEWKHKDTPTPETKAEWQRLRGLLEKAEAEKAAAQDAVDRRRKRVPKPAAAAAADAEADVMNAKKKKAAAAAPTSLAWKNAKKRYDGLNMLVWRMEKERKLSPAMQAQLATTRAERALAKQAMERAEEGSETDSDGESSSRKKLRVNGHAGLTQLMAGMSVGAPAPTCLRCRAKSTPVICGACLDASYCSEACKQADLARHKKVCDKSPYSLVNHS